MNSIFLIGNLGAEPEVKTTGSGTKFARIRIATTEGSGERKVTYWHNVTVWDKSAEVVEKYCHKGDRIAIQGSLHYNEWEKDGAKHKDAQIDCRNIELLGGGKTAAQAPAQAQAPTPAPAPAHAYQYDAPAYQHDEDVPSNGLPF